MWRELIFSSPSKVAEQIALRVSSFLNISYSCTRVFENNGDDIERVSIYIPPDQDIKSRLNSVKEILEQSGIKNFRIRSLYPERYISEWRRYFKPYRIGKIWIAPPWKVPKIGKGEKLVLIKPAMAFGTGLHPTTRMCIMALTYSQKYWKGKYILDVGTGTGILSICAVKLGAKTATAVDIDPVAIKEARYNCKLNYVSHKIVIRDSLPENDLNRYSLTVANIGTDELLQMSEKIPSLTEKEGYIILSGITVNNKEKLISRYTSKSILKKVWKRDSWITLLFKKL